MLMDLVCKSCGELMEDAVKNNMRIRVLASDRTKVTENITSEPLANLALSGRCTAASQM